MRPRIVILGGGSSEEREVSIRSAQAVYHAIKDREDAHLKIMEGKELPADLQPEQDILFLTTHGTFGEDGNLQQLLDEQGFIYIGTDSAGSRLCFDKQKSRLLAEKLNVKVADGFVFQGKISSKSLWRELGPKMVLKPMAQGSSVGLHIICDLRQLEETLPLIKSKGPYLAEKFIEGRELTIGVLNGEPLATVEIIPNSGVYDFSHKYTSGLTKYKCPAHLPASLTAEIRKTAYKLFNAAGCRDFARMDFRLGRDGKLYFLEINTLPGLTPTSLLPKSAVPFGHDFSSLINEMLRGARARFVSKYAMCLV